MARMKRTSPSIENANTRAAALESIDAALDLGNGLTLAAYKSKIASTAAKLTTYNSLLSQVDGALNALEASEVDLNDNSERMLAGVASKFGKNSDEYEQAGGTKKSERKRPTRKPKTP